jgi:hypothetical protein
MLVQNGFPDSFVSEATIRGNFNECETVTGWRAARRAARVYRSAKTLKLRSHAALEVSPLIRSPSMQPRYLLSFA